MTCKWTTPHTYFGNKHALFILHPLHLPSTASAGSFILFTMTHIFLYGPSGTGKSTLGKKLARNLKLPLIDIDSVIETKIGMSITQFMGEQGEPAFRDLESSALYALANEQESVIALGGGALLRDENRA